MPEKGPRGFELQQGEVITLAASAARTAGANGTSVYIGGERLVYCVLLDITASATEAGDTLDVYIDVSFDDTTWVNVVHFTQQAGNGAAAKGIAVISPSGSGTATTVVTSDVAAATVRPGFIGPYLRARWAIADATTTGNSSHTFSVTAFAM